MNEQVTMTLSSGWRFLTPEEHGSFDARTSNSSGPHEAAKGRNQAAPPPSFCYANKVVSRIVV